MTGLRVKLLIFSVCLACQAAPAIAAGQNQLSDLNEAYKNSLFQEALDGYLAVIAKDPMNAGAFYNAGNAYFRLNKPGMSVLYYAKAFKLSPRNLDFRANLEFALKRTSQTLVPEGVPRIMHILYYMLSDSELKALATLLFWLALILFSCSALLPAARDMLRTPIYISALIAAAAFIWFEARASSSPFSAGAVITDSPSVALLSGPGDNFKTYASLPEGRLIRVLYEGDPAYYEIGIPREGIKGWIKKTSAQKI